ncbi:hypothetical protein V8F33_007568 [Rhypophila sp. PSN 637]
MKRGRQGAGGALLILFPPVVVVRGVGSTVHGSDKPKMNDGKEEWSYVELFVTCSIFHYLVSKGYGVWRASTVYVSYANTNQATPGMFSSGDDSATEPCMMTGLSDSGFSRSVVEGTHGTVSCVGSSLGQ